MSKKQSPPPGLLDDFRHEFPIFWESLPDKGLFFGLLTFWLLLFQFLGHCSFNFSTTPSLYAWMWGAYSAPALDSSHGKLIPAVILVLLWLRRKDFVEAIRGLWWPALLLLGGAALLHIAGFIGQQPRLSIIALFLGIYSLIGVAWGKKAMRRTFFPFVLFVFAIPFGNALDGFTLPLRLLSTKITFWIAHGLFALPLVQQGTQLFDANGEYNYDVAAACSGIRSIVALSGLTTVYGVLAFQDFWKRWIIILSAIPLALISNVARLTAIVLGAEVFGEKAGKFIHEWFGFVTYALALFFLFFLGNILQRRVKSAALEMQPT